MAFLEFVLVRYFSQGGSEEEEEESGELEKRLSPVKDNGDKICRVAFPVAFLMFLIIYFAVYAF